MTTQMKGLAMPTQLAGYTVVEQIYEGSRTVVYRAVQPTNQRPVVIKLLRNEHPSFSELVQFRNQYAIAKELDIPGVVQLLSLDPHNNGYALIMEDFGGISLRLFNQGKPLAVERFFLIALQITDILHQLHQQQVIHKDIKPANILIQPDTQEIKLIDFSVASLLPRETQEIQNPHGLEGTLAYLSPEQTGRMNRGIDYRSDFYSLGVTFFELLTGQLPFQTNDPMELLHCHLAQPSPSVCEVDPDLPLMLGEIICKLMAKNAEDRYQSALGLKHDLLKCQAEHRTGNQSLRFELGERDISDRFLIPEKLYGREAEIQTLLDAFGRVANGASELMLVAGFSGIGKTAVVNEVHKPVVRWNGYFIQGKYDQFNRNSPFSAFVQAFRGLMEQLLSESDDQLTQWRSKILKAVGENGQVLIDVIPELEALIGPQTAVPDLSGNATQNRFNRVFHQFIAVFATPQHPLVIFLDDLQWADSASLDLLKLLLTDAVQGYLFIMGAYRDNEVCLTHPLMTTLEDIQKAEIVVNTVSLAPLSQADVNHLISDTLNGTGDRTLPLTELVYQKTQGNPFFITQFLKTLSEAGLITFDWETGSWQCDLAAVKALALTEDVVEFMALQLQKLPAATQEMLKLAACIGAQFELETLAIVSGKTAAQVAVDLWKALQEELLLPVGKAYQIFQPVTAPDLDTPAQDQDIDGKQAVNSSCRFLHDRVQQAAYSLIPDDQKQATHLKIGQLLLNNTPQAEREDNLFDIVNHLNAGIELVTGADQRHQLAELNLLAGQKAQAATAYAAAARYFGAGISLLSAESWQNQYPLTLALYEAAVEAAYLNINFAEAQSLADIVLQHTSTLLDRVKIYELQIQMYMAQAEMPQALEAGLLALELLGVDLDRAPALLEIALPTVTAMASMPVMTDPHQLAIQQILMALFPSAYTTQPELLPRMVTTMLALSLEHGQASVTALGYIYYGLLLCGREHLDTGYSSGLLALKVLEQFSAKELECRVTNLFNSFIRPWKQPIRDTLAPLARASHIGFETGDIEYASYATAHGCTHHFLSGEPLEDVQKKQAIALDILQQTKQDHALYNAKAWQQLVANLVAETPNLQLTGQHLDEAELLPVFCAGNDRTLPFATYVAKCVLNYLFEDHSAAVQAAAQASNYLDSVPGFITVSTHNFYQSLALLAQWSDLPQVTSNSEDVEPIAHPEQLQQVEHNQTRMQGWMTDAPANFEHKYTLVEAEKARLLKQWSLAIDLYDQAIAGAKANGYFQEEALANELAAKFYQHRGKERIARDYLIEAYYGYARWGAKAKLADLEAHYPQLLMPILQQTHTPLSVSETVFASGTATSTSTSSSSLADALDLSVVLKASQALSSEIELEKLLSSLLSLVIKEAGASKCVLMLFRDKHLLIKGLVSIGKEPAVLQNIPIEESQDIPLKLIHRVEHQQQMTVLIDATADPSLANDPYVMRQQPKSILCHPIVHQGNLKGVLYLENELVVGAFTKDRVELLNLLCTQAAISLENSRLYEQAQQYAQQLEASQLQIVQNEKMATLGNLVAGVAHEINNPVGFLNGSINNAKEYVQDVLEHLELYQQHHPDTAEPVQDHAEDIELDFLTEDLPKLLDSMKGATDRIKGISTSLRTFSRADTEHKVSANLLEGLDSTLLILKYRLKGNEQRPAIEVIKKYSELPEIDCFPGQLNQVFMNILANAIDMFDEMAQKTTYEDLKNNPQQITITTAAIPEQNILEIRIRDNGKGISEDMQGRIFDHLFTTKAVGKGTGLGLAIAHQIVTETHSGRLIVESAPGQGSEFIIHLSMAVST
jgi:predicted ATPase/signal transduction histidine kinase